jgi:hypothetical protein
MEGALGRTRQRGRSSILLVKDADHTRVCCYDDVLRSSGLTRVGGGGNGLCEDEKIEHRQILHECALTMMGRGESTARNSTSIKGVVYREML